MSGAERLTRIHVFVNYCDNFLQSRIPSGLV